ncbi:hypothetical protein GIB67_034439 [Kingdonia uniflora]|uniref:Pre-PUA domain-containing protein n=1 Tax=Kingdonia uniflora TaxID=39325 RepID=A0A7J7PAX8_9MAGN|nr:hypothetical protein GIB67_034439 [Kingdonia uniflora]
MSNLVIPRLWVAAGFITWKQLLPPIIRHSDSNTTMEADHLNDQPSTEEPIKYININRPSRVIVLPIVRFTYEEVSSKNQVKASVQRKIRLSIADEYPGLDPVLDDLFPKKLLLIVAKWYVCLFSVMLNPC